MITQIDCTPPQAPLAESVTLDPEGAAELAVGFKALADPNRITLLTLIAAEETGEACVCDLTEPLGLGQPTVSHHLKVLVDAGLLIREKRGTWSYYSVVPGALQDLFNSMTERTAH
ncbi:metalloregulator ArsR/SmtB family transcription factor [Nesterenkonia sp. LB17]|uniref:ArsR/SmtB family transcription factor n=1 Tax=unclassified Nesterenkonia TaxID=2629769 RepID=UPI001F4C6907|nr:MULTISPECIES: metalloregulator ArsR/SmtB family transcription factor [unclassified Nesterenkonia]MCH8561036.1 metalloregulator ArsR/SmtB family transcription factor [Nesterenkonia sp. DZ6]MCH8563354.1 metalloregulator ArsR/SmtB family transcription factor [Nesterenkonia sp. YGD6]MCH8566573.1 metalloregulator ArsR/SmtB family transcription factor [Nesterenkonia sp. LB17]MCH8571112.1 metalloregulator ArsR/SmtB family transcription factor [Nesterenkonia sp. AY15]